jgi:radical SAM superfamily enzyme YgiQ (UPF0313 family)
MANLGWQWLFYALGEAGLGVGRVVWPDDEIIEEAERDGLRAIDDDRPAKSADVWFVSVSYENDLVRLAGMLRLAGLSPRAAERRLGDPLIVAGGVAPMLNPEPTTALADVCLLGEGHAALDPFLAYLKDNDPADRDAFLAGLRAVPGAYVGRFYEPRFSDDSRLVAIEPRGGFPERVVVPKEKTVDPQRMRLHLRTPEAAFGDAMLVETGRGCVSRCRFCAAGHLFLPYRPASPPSELPNLGETALGLVGSNISGHPDLDAWLEFAGERRVTLSSIRRGTLSETQWRRLADGGLLSVALAPEAGSERLRAVCNKPASDAEIVADVRLAAEAGIRNIKLYFLVGLPTEQADDLDGIVELTKLCRAAAMEIWRPRGRAGRFVVSVNPFVPKPQTPFQWAAFVEPRELRGRLAKVREGLRRVGNIEMESEPLREATLQAALSIGDRRAGDLAILADSIGKAAALKQWMASQGGRLLRPRELRETLPWDHISVGVKRRYLEKEHNAALAGRVSPPCDLRRACRLCGAC